MVEHYDVLLGIHTKPLAFRTLGSKDPAVQLMERLLSEKCSVIRLDSHSKESSDCGTAQGYAGNLCASKVFWV